VDDPSPTRPKNQLGSTGLKTKLGVVLLLLAVAGMVWWVGNQSAAPAANASSPGGMGSSVAARGDAAGYDIHVGEQLVYDFTAEGTLRLGSAKTPGAAPDLKLAETGQLRLTVYSASGAGWIIGFVWDKVHLTSDNGEGANDQTPADLAGAEVLVFMEKSGRIAQLKVPDSLSADARNSWRDTLARWQVVLPQTAHATRWTRVEEDATGEFVAQYLLSGPTLPGDLVKRKTRYLRLSSGAPSLAAAYKVASSVQIHFDGYPREIVGAEKITFDGIQALGHTDSTGDFSFVLEKSPTPVAARTLAQIDLNKYVATTWAGEFNADEDASAAEDNGDFATNLRDLRDLVQVGAMNKPDEIRAAEKLIHQLKATPGLADQLLDELRGKADDSPLASALLGILGAAGTPAAQADLFAVASSEDLPASFREMALFSYVQTGAPMPEADALLEGLYTQGGDLANTALLVLGAVGDKVRDSDPARFQQISDYVVGVLNTPGLSLNDYIAALNAVGNLGPSQVPAAVAQAAQSDNSLVRLNAIGSLARVTTDAALTLVMNAITNDPSPDVQAVAVKTLAAEKGAAAIGDLSAVATSGDSTAARQQALTQLAAFAATNPNVVTVITTAAQKDPAQEVRDYANQLLGMLNGNTQNAMVPAGQ
jgi:hypothetical protein